MADDGVITWPAWARIDDVGLARYASPQAARWLPLPVDRRTLPGPAAVAEAVYAALAARDIRYALEEYHVPEAQQIIRTPPQVLTAPREGTCLDLAALFCGLALAYDLLPVLIVLDGHALAAVATTHGLRDWNAYDRPGRRLLHEGPVTDAAELRALVDSGALLPVECTGFAQGRDFATAVQAGHRRLEQPIEFALDVAVAHYGWRIDPHPLVVRPGGYDTDIFRLAASAPGALAGGLRTLDFERIIEQRTRSFVGRGYVFAAIDGLLDDPDFDRGYILVRGEPGIGKTALLGQLIKTRGYVHHLNVAPEGIRSSRSFLANVCAQLILRYQLGYTELPPEATTDGAFLADLLSAAAARSPGPVVVAVDALDEAAADGLLFPEVLPAGVFFVVTSRESTSYQLPVTDVEEIYLDDNDPRNLRDVRDYITAAMQAHPVLVARASAWEVDRDGFTDVLVARSQGNFMYLVHVLADIRSGRLSPANLANIRNLPRGLRAYYERHWAEMQRRDRDFKDVSEPVLRILAEVREPVGVTEIAEWTGCGRTDVQGVLRVWRQFLNEPDPDAPVPRYRVYHASFQDFLAQEGMGLQPSRRRIIGNALGKISGFLDQDTD